MILRRSAALAAACTFVSALIPASQTWAADSHIRYFHRRASHSSRHSVTARSLPSRGIVSPTSGPASAVGRLAQVLNDNTQIIAGRERAGRVLSICPKGQYLAISAELPNQYAVLMIDHSIGYVAKSDVQLLDYQVVTNAPTASTAPAAEDTSSVATLGQRLVQAAQGYLGVPYVWGGNTTSGIDCSGFVKAVYSSFGITLPRHSGDQAAIGYDVPRSDWSIWVPGDRMYFACHHPQIDHTGMYIGGGYFIHASAGHGHQVAIDRVDAPYYSSHLVCVRRSQELLGEAAAPGPLAQPSAVTASVPDSDGGDPEASQR